MDAITLYRTTNQGSSDQYLGTSSLDIYDMIANWGNRLRKAMGEKEILGRSYIGGEFRPPTYRSYAESLDNNPWQVRSKSGAILYVVPYNHVYDGWKTCKASRVGFMASAVNSYEYAYDLWDDWLITKKYYPDLMDDGTFGVWMGLLPEPASVQLGKSLKQAAIIWHYQEPRVSRSTEMGRYSLPEHKCFVKVQDSCHWRIARAEAYVLAWEKMAANEPPDRYESFIQTEQIQLRKKI